MVLSPAQTEVNIEKKKPITLTWENIDVYTPSSHEGVLGQIKKKVCFFQEVKSKNIIKKGTFIKTFNFLEFINILNSK